MSTTDYDKMLQELFVEIPQWHKTLIDLRLTAYDSNAANTLDWDQVFKELEKEDEV